MLIWTTKDFVECPTCRAKTGSPILCRECLERREFHGVLQQLAELNSSAVNKIIGRCKHCPNGYPNIECPKHGR